ncbi:hypothetical protein J4573_33155 [Actinomadura barringtoniae]|uniref:Uncharacterized protein n=1 Tax=Actinomadura barringtoniae TaxID=1427535 RepID=A0A939PG17_9ACTN|nr:hypothetical protein [Actinomadura barringtoniae]MBO2451976.1 hypothetical protein [Actinomadura barringtoniae]
MREPFLAEVAWAESAVRVIGWIKRDPALPGEPSLEVLLRERDGDREFAAPTKQLEPGDDPLDLWFDAHIKVNSVADGGPLPRGLWDLDLAVRYEGESVLVPLGRDRSTSIDVSPQRHFLRDSTTVTVYFSVHGTLAIDVGGEPHTAGSTGADAVVWKESDEELEITGHLDFHDSAMPVSATLTLREQATGRVYEVIAMLESKQTGLAYKADIPMTRALIDDPLPRGAWDAFLILGFSGLHRELRLMAPDRPAETQVWRRLRHVKVSSSKAPAPLTITVGHS